MHQFENLGTANARGLCVVTPGLFGPDYFREMAEIINRGGPPDVPRIIAVMQKHGLRPVMPSPPA